VKALNIRDFPEDILRWMKKHAVDEGKSLRQWVIDNLRKLVEKDSK